MRSFHSNFYIRVIFAVIVATATLVTQGVVFAQSDPDYWIDPITVTARPYRPPSGGGIFPVGGGGGGGAGTTEPGGAGEDEKIRKEVCTRGQSAYNQAGCQGKSIDTSGLAAAVDSAVSQYAYSYLFAASVQAFAQSIWAPAPGTTFRVLVGRAVRDGADSCVLAGKPVASCVNNVLIFYGINSEWVPLGEINGADVNDYVNRLFDGMRDFNSAPVGSLIKQFNLGSFCQTVRFIAKENNCSLK